VAGDVVANAESSTLAGDDGWRLIVYYDVSIVLTILAIFLDDLKS